MTNWYDASWGFRKSHVITGSSGAGTNYVIPITVYYGSGTDSGSDVYLNSKCKTDFGDVRFTTDDGTTLLNYWQDLDQLVTGTSSVFWVQVAADLGSDATIYIYYGNSGVSTTSNGTDTFIVWDDMSGGTIDSSKWATHVGGTPTGSISQGSGEIQHINSVNWGGENHYTKDNLLDKTKSYKVRFNIRYPSPYCNGGDNHQICLFDKDTVTWGAYYYDFPTSSHGYIDVGSLCAIYSTLWELTIHSNGTYDLTRISGTNYMSNVSGASITDWASVSSNYAIDFVSGTYSTGRDTFWSKTFIRPYVSPEPANSDWGTEESGGSPSIAYYIDTQLEKLGIIKTYGIDCVFLKKISIVASPSTASNTSPTQISKVVVGTTVFSLYPKLLNYGIDTLLGLFLPFSQYDIDIILQMNGITKDYGIDVKIALPQPTETYLIDTLLQKKSSLGYSIDMKLAHPVQGEQIVNGGFETGDLTGWTPNSEFTVSGGWQHSGVYGAGANSPAYVEQTLVKPVNVSDVASFGFWAYIIMSSDERWFGAIITYTDDSTTDCGTLYSEIGSWYYLDLTGYLVSGKAIKKIKITTDGNGITYNLIDDVSLWTGPPPIPPVTYSIDVILDPETTGPARVQGPAPRGESDGAGQINCSLDNPPTNGDILVAVISTGDYYNYITVTGISQTGVNWSTGGAGLQKRSQWNDSNYNVMDCEIWVGIVTSDSASKDITVSLSGGPEEGAAVDVFEYSGIDTSDLLDQTASATYQGADADTGTTSTTTVAKEVWIGGWCTYDGYTTATASNGFLKYDGTRCNVSYGIANTYLEKIVSTIGTAETSGNQARNGCGCIITLKGASGPAPPITKDYSIDTKLVPESGPKEYGLDIRLVSRNPLTYSIDNIIIKENIESSWNIDVEFERIPLLPYEVDVSLKMKDVPITYKIDIFMAKIKSYDFDLDLFLENIKRNYGIDIRLSPTTLTEHIYRFDTKIGASIFKTFNLDTRFSKRKIKHWNLDTEINSRYKKTYGLDTRLANKLRLYFLAVNFLEAGKKLCPIDVYLKQATTQRTLTYHLDMKLQTHGKKNYLFDFKASLPKSTSIKIDAIFKSEAEHTYGFDINLIYPPDRTQIKNSGGTLEFYPIEWNETQKCTPAIRDVPMRSTGQFIDSGTFTTETRQIEFTFRATDDEKDTILNIFDANEPVTVWLYHTVGKWFWIYNGWLSEPKMEFEYIMQEGGSKLRWWKITLTLNIESFGYSNISIIGVR